LGSDAPANQRTLPPNDMVVRSTLLARDAIGMERTRIRKELVHRLLNSNKFVSNAGFTVHPGYTFCRDKSAQRR
jgi:hypothetical protein